MSGLPIQYDEGFIEGPGGSRLHAYWRQGLSDAPLLWNVHGFQGDGMGNKAIALLESAARNNLSFISVDFRGHGQSSPTHANGQLLGLCHESLLSDMWAIRTFIATWHQGPRVLVGASMGGYASSWFAAEHSEAVQGLVLVAPAFRFGSTMLGRIHGLTAESWKQQGSAEYQGMTGPELLGWPLYEQSVGRSEESVVSWLKPEMPIRIYHAIDDDVIPYTTSVAFTARSGDQTELVLSRRGGHRLQESAGRIAQSALELALGLM